MLTGDEEAEPEPEPEPDKIGEPLGEEAEGVCAALRKSRISFDKFNFKTRVDSEAHP